MLRAQELLKTFDVVCDPGDDPHSRALFSVTVLAQDGDAACEAVEDDLLDRLRRTTGDIDPAQPTRHMTARPTMGVPEGPEAAPDGWTVTVRLFDDGSNVIRFGPYCLDDLPAGADEAVAWTLSKGYQPRDGEVALILRPETGPLRIDQLRLRSAPERSRQGSFATMSEPQSADTATLACMSPQHGQPVP